MRTDFFKTGKIKLAVLVFLGSIVLTSCNKDNDDATVAAIDESEAVDAISGSLSAESNGMAKTIETTSAYAQDEAVYSDAPELNCGQLYTTVYDDNYDSTNFNYTVVRMRN